MARAAPIFDGLTMSPASQLAESPSTSAKMVAPRARADSSVSITNTPAPSPSTMPRRSLEYGRQVSGAMARIDSQARQTKGLRQASVPPATAAWIAPWRSRRNASPIAWVEEAQAVEMVNDGPHNL